MASAFFLPPSAAEIASAACQRRSHRRGRSICADNFTGCVDQLGRQERDVASAAANIEHSHPGDDPGAGEELPGHWVDELGLSVQPPEFPISVAKFILVAAF
jgi:hypothetical protein